MRRDVHSGRLKLNGEEHPETLREATNYASTLVHLKRFEEAKAMLRKTVPVARRVLGDSNETTFKMRLIYGQSFYTDTSATLDDLREGVTTLEETERTACRVFGGAHPLVRQIQKNLQDARAALRARETPPPGSA